MSEIIRCAWAPTLDLEIRGDGRTVYGLAVPFDEPAKIRDWDGEYLEVFRRGAFRDTIRERGARVKFLANHDRGVFPLGRAAMLKEDAAGLVGEFRVSSTQAGDEALELIRDGVLDAFSIGFVPLPGGTRETLKGTGPKLVERIAVKLMEVSAVAFPAYEGAAIAGVRTDLYADPALNVVTISGPDQPNPQGPDQPATPDQRAPFNDVDALINAQRRRKN